MKYKTQDGIPVTVLTTTAKMDLPVVCLVHLDDGDAVMSVSSLDDLVVVDESAHKMMTVNVPTQMPELSREKMRKFAVQNRILVDFDGKADGKNGFFTAHDSEQGDFNRLAMRCKGLSELDLYNAILEVEI